MKKLLTIVTLVTLGTLTGCTTSTPTVDESKKVATSEVKQGTANQVSEAVQDKAVSVAKTAAVGAGTKKVKDITSKKK